MSINTRRQDHLINLVEIVKTLYELIGFKGCPSANGPDGDLSQLFPSFSLGKIDIDSCISCGCEAPEMPSSQISNLPNTSLFGAITSNSADAKGRPEKRGPNISLHIFKKKQHPTHHFGLNRSGVWGISGLLIALNLFKAAKSRKQKLKQDNKKHLRPLRKKDDRGGDKAVSKPLNSSNNTNSSAFKQHPQKPFQTLSLKRDS